MSTENVHQRAGQRSPQECADAPGNASAVDLADVLRTLDEIRTSIEQALRRLQSGRAGDAEDRLLSLIERFPAVERRCIDLAKGRQR